MLNHYFENIPPHYGFEPKLYYIVYIVLVLSIIPILSIIYDQYLIRNYKVNPEKWDKEYARKLASKHH